MTDLKASLTKEEFQGFTEPLPKLKNVTIPELPTSPHNYLFLSMDLETTGLERKSEILQISCSPSNVETESFSENLFPERQIINQAATQVHGISVDFRNGQKTLMRRGTELAAVSQTQVTPEKFIENSSPATAFVEEMKSSQDARAR
ncbi:unnamed protein product [Porites lobata]|uniref:Exonuclease domain-containing protein n=1 Tax=Porites lobata TaxID=104759 RepID=A0ABN8NRZ1_9CNID|nr:unnamed protein product [Porites lobata]